MQRLITAFIALLSLVALNVQPAPAQDKPVEPTAAGQEINGHIDGKSTSGNSHSGATADPSKPASEDSYTLFADQTIDNIVVRDKAVRLAGRVEHDVLAINCRVIIEPSARVGNYLTVIGGSVENRAGGEVKVIKQNAALASGIKTTFGGSGGASSSDGGAIKEQQSWSGGQFALLFVGLMSALIALIVAPRATLHTSETVSLEPGRCLAFGSIGVLGMLLLLGFNYVLMASPLRVIWLPVGAGVATAGIAVLAFGWVCGMHHVGLWFSRRFGRGSGSVYTHIAIGMVGFFLINVLLGGISSGLGVMGMFIEFGLALMGLGAALVSGFGVDPNWLTARMRGEVRWLARTPRL